MKKLICFVVLCIFLVTPSIIFAETKQLQFTLDQATKVAVDNSKQAKLDDFNIRTKEKQLKQIKDQGITGGYSSDSVASIMQYQIKIKIKPKQAELDLENANRIKRQNLYNLNLEVLRQASNIYITNKELEKENKKLVNLNERYKILKAKNSAGIISDDEVSNMEWSINTKENANKDLQERLATAYLSFKKLLNIPLDNSLISLNFTNEYKAFSISNIDDYVLNAQNSSYDVYNKQQNLQIEKDTLDITSIYFIAGQYEYDSENLNLENAKNDVQDSLDNVEVDVKNRYNNLLSQKDKVDLADTYLILADKKLKNTELRYKNGLVDKTALLGVQDSYLDAAFQKEGAISKYNIMKAEIINLTAY